MSPGSRSRRPGSTDRLFRGYGPLLAMVVAFLCMAILAPTVAPERVVVSNPAVGAAPSGPGASTDGSVPAGGDGAGPVDGPPPTEAPEGTVGCAGLQVVNDPYSPPCREWAGGDNGGATSQGVDATTIRVTLRDPGPPYDFGEAIAQLAGRGGASSVSRQDWERTYRVLAEYFNENFEFYGRRIEIDVFRGRGSVVDEVLGAGRSTANADGITAGRERGAFADVSFQTIPYAEALVDNGVIVTNPVYPNAEWFAARHPYAWGYWVDCDKGVRMVTDFLATTLAGRPAEFAGGRLTNQPRRYGIVFPDTPEYRACGNQIVAGARSVGVDMHSATYSLNVQAITDRGRGIAQEFAQRGITTVLLATDPLFPYFMTSTAALQADWRPEWIQLGAAFLDRDFSGQLYDQAQWNRAFGISLVGQTVPARSTAAYAAYQSVDPTTSPSPYVVELAYYQLYVLAIGLHLAGPDLTPHTFASGMRSYVSPGAGQAGAWAFPEGQWTAPQDGRIVWWEATGTSPFNNQPGRYIDDGRRFPIGGLPDSGVTLFPNGIR